MINCVFRRIGLGLSVFVLQGIFLLYVYIVNLGRLSRLVFLGRRGCSRCLEFLLVWVVRF